MTKDDKFFKKLKASLEEAVGINHCPKCGSELGYHWYVADTYHYICESSGCDYWEEEVTYGPSIRPEDKV